MDFRSRINLNLRDLHYMLAITEELHFRKAAERLGVAQPQLSEVIRRLEDYAKVRLFTRRPHVRLTPAGDIFAQVARRMLSDLDQGIDRAQAVASGKVGTVSLGFCESGKLTELPRALKEFRELHPDVKLNFVEGNSSQLLDLLERRELDLIISSEMRQDTDLCSVPIFEGQPLLVLPEGHPLLGHTKISLKKLRDEQFILFHRSAAPSHYDQLMQACRKAGLVPNIAEEVDSASLMFALVRAGFGISFEHSMASKFTIPGIHYRPIQENMPNVVLWLGHSSQITPSGDLLRTHLLKYATRSGDGTRARTATGGTPRPPLKRARRRPV